MRRKKRWYHDPNYHSNVIRMPVVVAISVALMLSVIALIGGVGYAVDNASCSDKGGAYNVETNYSFWASTCFATVNGQTVNIDQLHQNVKGQIIYLQGDKP